MATITIEGKATKEEIAVDADFCYSKAAAVLHAYGSKENVEVAREWRLLGDSLKPRVVSDMGTLS